MLGQETWCSEKDVHNFHDENYVKLERFEDLRNDCYLVYRELQKSRDENAELKRKLKEEQDKNNVNSKN